MVIRTVKDFYFEVLLAKEINKSVFNNEIPDVSQIESDIYAQLSPPNDTPTSVSALGYPITKKSQYTVIDSEQASASKMNTTIDSLQSDLEACYKAYLYNGAYLTQVFDELQQKLLFLNREVDLLREETSNLLLLSNNVEGFFDFVGDDFSNLNSVDQRYTTAIVDCEVGAIAIPSEATYKFPASELIGTNDVSFYVVTKTNYISTSTFPGTNLLNLFNDSNLNWIQQIRMRDFTETLNSEIIIHLPNKDEKFNKILVKSISTNTGDVLFINIEYSMDSLSWRKPEGVSEQRILDSAIFNFPGIKAQYWKVKLSKRGYDQFINDQYLYNIGLSHISFFVVDPTDTELLPLGEMYSLPLSPSSEKEFSKMSLSACETVPLNTLVEYYIAPLTEDDLKDYLSGALTLDQLKFTPIDPIERTNKVNPSLIDYGVITDPVGFQNYYYKEDAINFYNKKNYSIAINYKVADETITEYLVALRNTGNNILQGISIGVPVKVNGVDAGWSFDGRYYSTYFYCSVAKEIDLGQTTANLDGGEVRGKITITEGYHIFSTRKDYFRVINPALITNASVVPDIMYPYNHKYLIEGIKNTLYGDDLTVVPSGGTLTKKQIIDPNDIYTGIDVYGERKCVFVSAFEFTQIVADDNFDIFSIAQQINTGDNYIVVKEKGRLNTKESFAIISQNKDSGKKLFKAIVVKIALKTSTYDVTPIVDEYVLRLAI